MSQLSTPAEVPSLDPSEPGPAGCAGCGPSRRSVLRGAAAAGVAGAATVGLAACSSGSSAATSSGPVTLGEATGVPVGGGTLYRSQQIVVTQPTAGAYKAFSAVCTHAGCIVDGVSNGVIQCPCHGSQFNIATGAVVTGPATSALPAKTVTVTGGKLVVSD
ncbi:Rieske (2Fe-2S) protein [Streptacidiphilus sp. 4-A2]|nr:Rieske (2Fe-2S) protein [Streptacidiphilus sp. 4-A2]